MRIGVDVGGTNTDAVVMDGARVIAATKSPTTEDVESGIVAAVGDVLRIAGLKANAVRGVMIGTTQFTNAFVERRRLVEVGIIRLALPATTSLRPLVDWPDDLVAKVGRHVHMAHGGFEFDGRVISRLREDEIIAIAGKLRSAGLRSIAVSSVFAPMNSSMEERVAEILRAEIPGVQVTLSSSIGRIGMVERENAAIMNASLMQLSSLVVGAFRAALKGLGVSAPFYISQNDGTLMTADHVEKYPVLTFASGPTNSMRGAAFLTKIKDAIVVDIGGTTTDVGVIAQGFPRESSVAVDVGGVKTNFRMPDVLSIGLGGGSHVRDDGARIGPDSVGYQLPERAMIFGGSDLTTSDIAVASGAASFGDRSRVRGLDPALVARATERIHVMLEEAIDRVKTSAADMPVVLVGGGGVLVSRKLRGASEVITPENAGVANAIGAAIAQVGGEVDRVFSFEGKGRKAALDEAKGEARARAVAAGAARGSVEILEVEEIPLAYLPGGAVRVRVKAVGDLLGYQKQRPAAKAKVSAKARTRSEVAAKASPKAKPAAAGKPARTGAGARAASGKAQKKAVKPLGKAKAAGAGKPARAAAARPMPKTAKSAGKAKPAATPKSKAKPKPKPRAKPAATPKSKAKPKAKPKAKAKARVAGKARGPTGRSSARR